MKDSDFEACDTLLDYSGVTVCLLQSASRILSLVRQVNLSCGWKSSLLGLMLRLLLKCMFL